MEKRRIYPVTTATGSVELAGSKYLANRWLILGTLAKQPVTLENVVDNDDINAAIEGLQALGYGITREKSIVKCIPRTKGLEEPAQIYTSHSGTFSRLVSPLAALEAVDITLTGSAKMNTRPMDGVFDALTMLGASIQSTKGKLPATITGPLVGNYCKVAAGASSQYVSALLLVAPTLGHEVTIELSEKPISTTYIDMTISLMEKLGVTVAFENNCYRVLPNSGYNGGEFVIPPDAVSSSYFLAAAAITAGKVTLKNYDFDGVQGEVQFYRVLEKMGCKLERNGNSLSIAGSESLTALDLDMGNMPDVVQTLSVVAAFAKGTTVMRNIHHLAFKESNRIVDTASELQKVGVAVEFGEDYLAVSGNPELSGYNGAQIETYDDHRMAMSMALLGSRVENIVINNAQVVSKSFPNYFDKLQAIGIRSTLI